MATLSERILGAPAGTYVDRKVDRAYSHDGSGIQAKLVFDRIGAGVRDPSRCSVIYDHITPANNSMTADLQKELREFALRTGMQFSEGGGGICHQMMSEGVVLPGEVVIGADSHSCTLGAFGAFATGVGASDMAGIWVSGETWLRVPETTAVRLTGSLPEGVEAKDIALWYVHDLGMDGANYQALEFIGDALPSLPMGARLTLCNMAVEAGAKTGLCYADAVTRAYLAEYGHLAEEQQPEKCRYAAEIAIDLRDLVPLLAVPHRVDSACPVSTYAGTPLDQVFIGTCTNGRYEDLRRAAAIMKGKKVRTRTIITPASRSVLMQAVRTGVLGDLIEAGCTICPPGCGPCLGAHMGVLGEGEVALSTANRNFRNRMGVGAEYYLSSPTTAAVSALAGCITDPGDVR